MLKWAIISAIIAALAALLGFGGLAGAAAGIAKLLFYTALALCLLLLLLGSLSTGRSRARCSASGTTGRSMLIILNTDASPALAGAAARIVATLERAFAPLLSVRSR